MQTHKNNERYLRLAQIIGRERVTPEQAERNRRLGKGPKRPCDGIESIIPVSRTTWYRGITSGRFPRPIKLTANTTVWRKSDIEALLESEGETGIFG